MLGNKVRADVVEVFADDAPAHHTSIQLVVVFNDISADKAVQSVPELLVFQHVRHHVTAVVEQISRFSGTN